MTQRSQELFTQAKRTITGGVNSPVRAFKSVGGNPLFIKSAQGAYVIDEDDHSYIDYVGSWGPMILGHNDRRVVDAICQQSQIGISFGAPTALEIELAERICLHVPSIECVRMVNSGTEATMTALRLARAATGRDKILKFAGGYHGHSDSLLVNAGSGAATCGVPSSPGVPTALAELTLTADYNDLAHVKQLFADHGPFIAAIIVEPVAGNMGCIPPKPGFLAGLRQICDDAGALLIFDEVMTGFRIALGGAQTYYGVTPDLTTLGKIIGGGLPVGALGGRRELMAELAPEGKVYQAGTLSGNPLAVSAGIATLDALAKPGIYTQLEHTTTTLTTGLGTYAREAGIALDIHQVGSMFSVHFADPSLFNRYFFDMLSHGVYFAPSPFESAFVSLAHGENEIELTLRAAQTCFEHLAKTHPKRTADEITTD